MKRCILHIGRPKTGTTSIQESLHHGLTDPAFHYCSFGELNVTRSVFTFFAGAPEKHHTHCSWSAAQNVSGWNSNWAALLWKILLAMMQFAFAKRQIYLTSRLRPWPGWLPLPRMPRLFQPLVSKPRWQLAPKCTSCACWVHTRSVSNACSASASGNCCG